MVMQSTRAVGAGLVAFATLTAFDAARAQSTTRDRTEVARGSAVMLVVRPRVGDTLQLQMEQTIEVSRRASGAPLREKSPVLGGTRQAPPKPPEPDYGPRRTLAAARVTRLLLHAHSVVESSDLSVTSLLATTDSMSMSVGTMVDMGRPQPLPLPLDGRQVRVRVAPDGSMRVSDPPPGASELGATLASIPGMFSSDAVRVGDRWERDIAMPSLPISGYRTDGVLRARFRFDSLTRNGRDAWISLEGSLHRDAPSRDLPTGTRVVTAGTIDGTLLLDRQRAWIIDARTVIDVQSEVAPGPGSAAEPVILDLRIEQRVRVK